jgi:ABC-type uncharacterized transport system involved in gliding motility auxiliary subunit
MKSFGHIGSKTMMIAAFVVGALFLLSVNILSSLELRAAQVDLTENSLYTLSQGTKDVISSIDEPIIVRLYFSKKLGEVSAPHKNYVNRVREMLEQYANLSNNKIRLRFIQPEPYSVEEDEAVNFGLQGIPLDQTGELGYFGLAATNSTDDVEAIPFLDPQREAFLEYDLTRAIFDLAKPKKKVVGLLTSLFIESDPMLQYKPWPVMKQISQFFKVRSLENDLTEIPDDIDVLLIVHPIILKEKAQYAIDQFILRGGKAVIFVDPHNESAVISPRGRRGAGSSDMGKLFDAWGINFTKDDFVADQTAAIRVSAPVNGHDVVADYLSWLSLPATHFNRNDVVTGELSTITMASAGAFSPKDGADIQFTPLIQSSPASETMTTDLLQGSPDPSKILAQFHSKNKRYTMAARIQGKFKSAFPDGPPKAKNENEKKEDTDESAEKKETHPRLTESTAPATMIIVADTDMLSSQFWLREQNFFGDRLQVPVANNADFLINALDNLSGSDALISLRSRGLSVRPFKLIAQIRNEAENRYRAKEQELQKKIDDLQAKLKGLQVDERSRGVVLTSSQRAAFDTFRGDMFKARKELRDVQLALRRDIESLDTILKAVNIWAMPIIVAIVAIIVAIIRRRRYRQKAIHG